MLNQMDKVVLSDSGRKCCLKLLAHRNRILCKWRKIFKNKMLHSLCSDMENNHAGLSQELPRQLIGEFLRDARVVANLARPKVVFKGMNLSQAVIFNFCKLAYKHSIKSASDCRTLDVDDFLQECYLKYLEMMHSWLPEKGASLLTFFWLSLKKRLSSVANQQGTRLTRLKNSDLRLIQEYERAKAKWPEKSFSDIVGRMGLTDKQAWCLSRAIKGVEVCGTLWSKEPAVADTTEEVLQRASVDEIIRLSNLSQLQEQLFRLSMESGLGWQAEFARNHISQVTGKAPSRMRITQVLAAAKKKVAKTVRSMGIAC